MTKRKKSNNNVHKVTPPTHAVEQNRIPKAKEQLRRHSSRLEQEEHFLDFLYQPHHVSGLIIFLSYLIHRTFIVEQENADPQNSLMEGLMIGAGAFLFYCMIQLRDDALFRPHPAVWRVFHGVGILYLVFLVFLICQPVAIVPRYLKMLDYRIGVPEPSKSYGNDCRIRIPVEEAEKNGIHVFQNLFDQFFDRFTLAHALGWFLKALIIRDWSIMWVTSFLFEILEVTFQHILPNFNECWWDHLILDVFGCNLFGMWAGMKTVEWLNGRQYSWTGRKVTDIRTYFGKMKRVGLQFTPYTWSVFRWQVFTSWRRCAIGVALVAVLLLGELNSFFVKSVLFIPIDSDVNLYRLGFWSVMTYMSVFDFYRFSEGKSSKIGQNAWLALCLVFLEVLLIVKHSLVKNLFPSAFPEAYVVQGWGVTILLVLLLVAVKVIRKLLVWAVGGDETFDESIIKTSTTPKHHTLAHKSVYVLERFLNRLFQGLSYLLALPLLGVLLVDCIRSTQYPPPTPRALSYNEMVVVITDTSSFSIWLWGQ